MQFNPPRLENIKDVLPHIQDNPAFIVVDKGFYTVIDYVYNHRDTFTNDVARECRGLKFETATGNIIARPYHKFHNLGECAGYHADDLDLNNEHVVLDKLDGSMVHTVICPSLEWAPEAQGLMLMTRMGLSDQARAAMAFMFANDVGSRIAELALKFPTSTFIFEYVGPNNRIVIPYPEEMLIMTGIRDIFSGAYSSYTTMAQLATQYGIPFVGTYMPSFQPHLIYDDEDKEGCVVRFDTGAMVKVKSEIYCRKHKSKELTESFKGVVQLVIDGTLDDVLAHIEPATVVRLEEYQTALLARLSMLHEGLRHILSVRKDMDQKSFALDIQANYPRPIQSLLFQTRKSGDGYAELIRLIKARYNKEADLELLFEDLDLPTWQY